MRSKPEDSIKVPGILLLPPNRVWRTYAGGKTLDRIEGKLHPADSHFAEDWIASTTRAANVGREEMEQEGLSTISLRGRDAVLKNLMESAPEPLLGSKHFRMYGAQTQFLLKLLDSAVRLHLQVHPTAAFARAHLGSRSGKTEAYYILGIRQEVSTPYIYLGFQHPLPRAQFEETVSGQDIGRMLGCFEKIPVAPGDVFIVPGGLPHAIGEGIFMMEIMEPTDFVARFEFERGGYVLPEKARFMGRDVGFATEMTDFTPCTVQEVRRRFFASPRKGERDSGGSQEVLIDSDQTACFSVRRLTVRDRFVQRLDSFCVGFVTKGFGMISAGDQRERVVPWSRFLIPYQSRTVEYLADEELEVVLAFPPP